jgi:undecaprenyl-diphosphatase
MGMTAARAAWNFLQANDYRLMRRVHRWRPPRWFRLVVIAATRMGDGWLWCGIGLALLLVGGPDRFAAIGVAGLAAFSGIVLFRVLKRISQRKRPCELEPHCWANLLPPDRFSFPSGHTITAFSVALVLSSYYPDLRWVLLPAAGAIAVSRILLGMHFLTDVIAGSAIGLAVGSACLRLFG